MMRGSEGKSILWIVGGLAVLVLAVVALRTMTYRLPRGTLPFEISDSAGIQIVASRGPAWGQPDVWKVGREPLLRLGVVDGDPAFQFSGVTGGVRLEDGTVAVADGSSQEVRFYRQDGNVEAIAGGPGGGPGEFTGLSGLGKGPDGRIWAWDFALRRITWLTAAGDVAGITSLGAEPPMLHPIGVLPDHTFVLKQLWGAGEVAQATETGLRRDPVAYVRFDADGALVDTVGSFPGREVFLSEEGGRGVMSTPPFARNSVGAIWGGEVAVGAESTFEIAAYTPEGDLTRVVRVLSREEKVGEDDVEAYIQERLAAATLEERPRIRQSLEEMPVPATKPAYGSIMADEPGNLWVGAWAVYPQVPSTWTVMDAEGRWLGDVDMPDGFFPLDIGADWVLGVERDAMDVEYVVLYSLRKGR